MTIADSQSQRTVAVEPAVPVGCAELVGRVEELERLGAAFETILGGRALTVLVGGDAGIGKSRLVEEFGDRVRLRGATVASGMCVPADGALAYAPVMGILRSLGRQLGKPVAARMFEALSGDAAPDSSGRPSPLVAGEFTKTVFFESILESVIEVAVQAPVLLVFEDLQWADSASMQLIDFLTRNLGDARVLIIGTHRGPDLAEDHPFTSWLAELSRHPRLLAIDLGGLDRAAIAALITDRTERGADPAVVESIWTRSQGNPFYAEELIAVGGGPGLPTHLQGIILRRVRELQPDSQRVLDFAAIVGSVVDHRLLICLSDLDEEALTAAVAEAVQRNLLVAESDRSTYRFRHALLREAIYGSLLPVQRSSLHRRVAVELAADPTVGSSAPSHRDAELAAHWWAAGDWAEALKPSLDAMQAALAVVAAPEALTFLERALIAAERAPGAAKALGIDRARLLEQGADVAYQAGANARAVELAQAAIDTIDIATDPIGAARCYTLLGRNTWGVGDSDAALAAYRQAVELLPAGEYSVELARLLAEEARGFMLMSLHTSGSERASEAIEAARAVGARDIEGHALNTLGCCRGALGFTEEGVELVRQSLAIAEELGSPEGLNRAYGNLASIFLDTGRLEDAAALMFDCAAVGEDLWGMRLNGATGNGVDALVRLGRYSDAEQVLAQIGTNALGVCAPGPWTLPAPMMIRRGRFDVAEDMIATARQMTAHLGDVQQTAFVLGQAAELDLERGRPDDAARAIEQALEVAGRTEDETLLPELYMWGARAIVDQGEAARTYGRALDLAALKRRCDEIVVASNAILANLAARQAEATPRTRAADAQVRAERSRLDVSDSVLWLEAASRWELALEVYPQAYCLWRAAEALLKGRVGRSEAAECLNSAWRISRRLHAEPLAARIANLAERGRIELMDDGDTRDTSDVPADLGLTPREVEILGELAAGRSDRQISESLFISKKTVSVHVSNVLRKLDAANRVEAGRIGQAHGLRPSAN